ncbi:hypothetical protein M413DRAFT_448756 [Hebeloma cylindrosporum]|uniref:Uncharacterized protein n=1 Tax=Hebeloma cylindrosporum TaxID=76867 RepID=A0A0C2Y7N8_HEBCY|nr:hypothetical protein M413DRAFT_448756 [Hebeloma cylindrosporum h7]
MFVPFISEPRLLRRKGGGGGGKSSSGGGKGSSSSSGGQSGKSSAKSSSSSVKSKSRTSTIKTGSSSTKSSTYGRGSSVPAVIPAGQLFAGRIAGGGTRGQIFGTRTYGSGYPGIAGRGTSGRNFPFIFWPLAWPIAVGGGAATAVYLHNHNEYGDPTNSSRPGGEMAIATFLSLSSPPTYFRVLADNATVLSLIEDLSSNCTSLLSTSSPYYSKTSAPYTDTPQPEQVVQYYRASSIALSVDGYSNTATYAADGTPDSPLPETVDLKLLDCLNQTIALAAPLIDGASIRWSAPNLGAVGVVWVLWWIFGFI